MVFSAFDDVDDLFRQMRQDQQAADECVLNWQAAVRPGDYVTRPGPGFSIYSEILADPEPRERGLENYRFTRSYSVACPGGELGDLHVSTIEKIISKEEFATAQRRNWS